MEMWLVCSLFVQAPFLPFCSREGLAGCIHAGRSLETFVSSSICVGGKGFWETHNKSKAEAEAEAHFSKGVKKIKKHLQNAAWLKGEFP